MATWGGVGGTSIGDGLNAELCVSSVPNDKNRTALTGWRLVPNILFSLFFMHGMALTCVFVLHFYYMSVCMQ